MLVPQTSSSEDSAPQLLPIMASVDRQDLCVRFSSDALSLANKHLKYPSTPERDHRPPCFPSNFEKDLSSREATREARDLYREAWGEDTPEDFFTDSNKPLPRRVRRLLDKFFRRNLSTRPPCIKVVQKAQAAGSSDPPEFYYVNPETGEYELDPSRSPAQ